MASFPQTVSPEHSSTLEHLAQRCTAEKALASPENVTARVEPGRIELIHDLVPQWSRLCDEVRSAPFYRPGWVAANVRAFEPHSEVALATARAGDRLVAVLPMIRKRAFFAGVPLTKLAGIANEHSVEFDIVRAPGALGDAAIRAIWAALKRDSEWQVLELPLLSLSGACPALLSLAAEEGFSILQLPAQESPVLRLPINGNGTAQPVGSRHFRHELRRFARILAKEVGTEPELKCCRSADPELLQRFFDLEHSGWKGKKGSAINCEPATRAFYEELAKEASAHGTFRLHSLEANGRMIAGAFSVATPDVFYPIKVAYDEALRRGGPGHLLFNAIVTECMEKGIRQLFFGGTNESYKSLWTQEAVPLYNAYVFSSDIRSRLAYGLRRNVLSPLGKLRRRVRERYLQPRPGSSERRAGTRSTQPDVKANVMQTVSSANSRSAPHS